MPDNRNHNNQTERSIRYKDRVSSDIRRTVVLSKARKTILKAEKDKVPVNILPEDVHKDICTPAGAMCTRNPLGTTSCRLLQMLYLLYGLANCVQEQLSTKSSEDRISKILSELWNGAIVEPQLKAFYACNNATHMDKIKLLPSENNVPYPETGEGSSSVDTFFEYIDSKELCVLPFGLTKTCNESQNVHIFHYFLILIDRNSNKIFIYNANGSDFISAHPKKIELTQNDFSDFIIALHSKDAHRINTFVEIFFMQGLAQPKYYDEGRCRIIYPDIKEGVKEELKSYIDFDVMYFPTLREKLIIEAKNFAIKHYRLAEHSLDTCATQLLLNDCEIFVDELRGGKPTKRRKPLPRKTKRLKLKTRSFSKRMKR